MVDAQLANFKWPLGRILKLVIWKTSVVFGYIVQETSRKDGRILFANN